MTTLVTFHAHPDDEAIATGGTMARFAAHGHRVVAVFGTGGEHGEVEDGFLPQGETLGERRAVETAAAAELLGVARVEFLGYSDSGMMGTPENDLPGSFWSAEVGEAAQRLAQILIEEGADILTIYDDKGTYGHPDHIQVHRVGIRAAAIAGTPRVFESVVNKDELNRQMEALRQAGETPPIDGADLEELGVSEDLITHAVDVREFIDIKRRAMAAHASQIPETSFFLTMPPPVFEMVFGTEYFVLRGATPGDGFSSDLLEENQTVTNIGAPYISTRFTVRPGHEEEFVAAWQALTGWAMGEGIVTGATLLQSEAEPHIFRGMSYWIDEAARAHAFNDPAALEMLSGLGSHCSDVESAPYRLRATAIGTFY